MLNTIYQLVTAEFKEFYRNPGILFWALGFPLIIATILGFAFTKKQEVNRNVGVIVTDSNTSLIQTLQNKVPDNESYTKFTFIPYSLDEAKVAMKRGRISLYMEKKSKEYKYYFDSNNSESHLTYLLLDRMLSGIKNTKDQVNHLSNKGDRYIDFLIPGLLALGIMNSCLWGTAWTLMDMRSKKLLRRLISTPLPKPIFLFSHFISRSVLSGIEYLLLMTFAYFAFNVEIQGSALGLLILFLSGTFAFSGIAIFASSRASNSQIANGVINAISFPMMMMSGIFFSYHNFPDWATSIIRFFPLTLLADSVRAIFIEGAGLNLVVGPSLILVAVGFLFFGIGLKIYKWD
ncbi:MAG: ABC transporter permease [Leptospiraceae bacterium]|jgi:ABC-2 type transport system permease protein|nr:ABC transporter permease [Leptospiraceae bacterium]MBL0265267.1 ABC transporter permease [Leptospiraceae bacterium]MBP9163571.1 ABC transporter permease [Leptospiraceae bacterium]